MHNELQSLKNKIFNENCLSGLKKLPSASVPLIITSIPLEEINQQLNEICASRKRRALLTNALLDRLLADFSRISTNSGSIYIFCAAENIGHLRAAMIKLGFNAQLCFWDKSTPTSTGKNYRPASVECCLFGWRDGAIFTEHSKVAAWQFPESGNNSHPTEKPLKLIEYLINTSSLPSDVVLDPFLGAGTTAAACINTGRNYLGFEHNKVYFDLIQKRLAAIQPPATAHISDPMPVLVR